MKAKGSKREKSRVKGNRVHSVEALASSLGRRDFVRLVGFGPSAAAVTAALAESPVLGSAGVGEKEFRALRDATWPVLRVYGRDHLARIALPIGGIGTGTVSLGGRGDLRDWEIVNRPAKGFVPARGDVYPFFALFAGSGTRKPVCRVLEGPLEDADYEGSHGSTTPNDNLPRFRECSFAAAYPFGRVMLSDPDVPVEVHLKAFNPFIPADAENSGLPVAVLRFELYNRTAESLAVSVCGNLPNFIGMDGSVRERDWKGDYFPAGAKGNHNEFREGEQLQGIYMSSAGVDPKAEQWGTLALATTEREGLTFRTDWKADRWGSALLDFWDDFAADGRLEERPRSDAASPIASLAVRKEIPPNGSSAIQFLLGWHFPNRMTWTPLGEDPIDDDIVGNYYTTRYTDAWDVLERTVPRLPELQKKSFDFVTTFCSSSLPAEVKEAALFNLSTLRTQTCFRTADGRFFGWEGSANNRGCCHGSCTHVWNYEQATAFLFGDLALSMREVEFIWATDESGMMSFRVNLPLGRSRQFAKAAADGQMGCIMKMYRDWQLSGDTAMLRTLWPKIRAAVEFCWIPGGWDADQDGVMEGCQHNTMDVEYYGPNPQMGIWYLGALRAAEEMALALDETGFADICHVLFNNGRAWIDGNLFNGEYYEQKVVPPRNPEAIAPSLRVGMGAVDPTQPEYQLGAGCLVDQLVGQYMAHVCGLGYLVSPDYVRRALSSILRHNGRSDLYSHFNSLRSFALGPESVLLMASYPKERPENPFPYFTEVMTGFEYTAAAGMLYEGMIEEGLHCIANIRERYDGRRRNPFDEAECGHHYARAMASWAAVLALTGFRYSAVDKSISFAPVEGRHFWSNGRSWGTAEVSRSEQLFQLKLSVRHGKLELVKVGLAGFPELLLDTPKTLGEGEQLVMEFVR